MEISQEGTDLLSIGELAEEYGFLSNGYQLELEELDRVHLPCIAHVDGNHFVVLYKASRDKIYISDPAIGLYILSIDEFDSRWTGIVLELKPSKSIFQNDEIKELEGLWNKRKKSVWESFYKASFGSLNKVIHKIVIISFILTCLSLALPFFTQVIVDEVLTNNNLNLLYLILFAILFVLIVQVFLTYTRNLLMSQIKIEFEHSFFSKFFKHLIYLEKSYFDRHPKEDFINRFNENTKIRDILNPVVVESLIDIIFLPILVVALVAFNFQLGLIVLGCLVLYALYAYLTTTKIRYVESEIFETTEEALGKFMDFIGGIDTVKLLGIERIGHWKWKNSYTHNLNKVLKSEKWYIKVNTVTTSLFFVCQAVVLWYGSYQVFNNQMTLGTFVAFITLFEIVSGMALGFRQQWLFFTDLSVSVDKINDLLTEKRELSGRLNLRYKESHKAIDIEIAKLNFSYLKSQENPTIDDFGYSLKAGMKLGIVGRNGSGKSTLVKILCGLYNDYQGSILLNNQELRRLSKRELRRRVFMVQQDTYIFDGTLKQNLKYSNPLASDQQILMAAEKAGLMDFIQKNYLGLNTVVGGSGIKLSGGERLKVAFAQLFLRKPSIIILDEASSALDQQSEKELLSQVFETYKHSTIISIAHRLNTLRNSDEILVMDQGQLAEHGTHLELIEKGGLYHTLLMNYVEL